MSVGLHILVFAIDNADCGYYWMMNWSMIDSEDFLEMVAISNSMTVADRTKKREIFFKL